MDDDRNEGGLGSLAMYQLGRWSVESEHELSAVTRDMVDRRRGLGRKEQWKAANQALAQENAQLRQHLADALFELDTYKMNYDELRRWADGAQETMRKLGVLKPRR